MKLYARRFTETRFKAETYDDVFNRCVIGVGLFLGCGAAIHSAGSAALFTYGVYYEDAGEMASVHPTSGSFSTYTEEGIGRGPGILFFGADIVPVG